jgi:hypothetical protein
MLFSLTLNAQNVVEVQDTLTAAHLTASQSDNPVTGTRIIMARSLQSMVSATGEADVIKYVQTLPGISTGAEGSSAIYVRGGNIGSNLITLDGVPLYGSSHLLGFTSVFSQDAVSETRFQVGGFTSEEGNLTGSHIQLFSAKPNFDSLHWNASCSNFMLGTSVTSPLVKDRLAFTSSVRISPIGLEYALLKGLLSTNSQSVSDASALVYDFYSKLEWRVAPQHSLALSVFNSLDAYRYTYNKDSDEHMRWGNLVISLNHTAETLKWRFHNSLAYNSFHSKQGMIKKLGETENNLAIGNRIKELSFHTYAIRALGAYAEWQVGIKSRFAAFSPGSASHIQNPSLLSQNSPESGETFYSSTNTLHTQLSYMNINHCEFRAAARANLYLADTERDGKWRARIDPEASLLARWYPFPWLGLEATADWLTQYHHTLEGVPLGWSLDMIIPSDTQCEPEQATQYYAGLLVSFGKHKISIGGYTKTMRHLVYFTDATQLFSSVLAGWRNNIDTGQGHSKGIEFLYEKEGEHLTGRIAYTLSKTDRVFPRMNAGEPFPAKFDRTHILNATVECLISKKENREIGLTSLFTFQSGHWETVAAGSYYGHLLTEDRAVEIDWFTTTNNYRMPNYLRWDMGAYIKWNNAKNKSMLNLGIYNLLNRHNPYTITYDGETRQWKQISLLPIMPSISYRVQF